MSRGEKSFTSDEIKKFADVDLYEKLAINKESFTPELVKKRFKKLALKYHPDKNPNDPDAKRKFMMLEVAYKILRNEDSRQMYDVMHDEALLESDIFESMKDFDRTKIKINSMTEKDFADEIRRKNLEIDPNFYDCKKFTDAEISAKIAEERNDDILSKDLQEKFKKDMETLNDITDEKERAKRFNDMFEMSRTKKVETQQIMSYGGNRSLLNTSIAKTNRYDTMYNDLNTFEEAFDHFNNELDEDDIGDMSFADYQKQYTSQFDTYGEIAKHTKLTNGRGDYRFDTDE